MSGELSLSFVEAAPWAPTQFRYIVTETELCTPSGKTQARYEAIALEWDMVASGDTQKAAVDRLEHLIFAQGVGYLEWPDAERPKPAPEDYQRVATSGDYFISTDERFVRFAGRSQWLIVGRGTIDMTKSPWRVFPKSTP